MKVRNRSFLYLTIILTITLAVTAILIAAPKDDKLWITRLDNQAGFQIVVPDLNVKEIHADPVVAVEMVFADIGKGGQEVERIKKQIAELEAALIVAQAKVGKASEMTAVFDVAKDAADMLLKHTFWVEKYGPIKEVAVTELMGGQHRVAFAWSRMHPE